MNFRCSKLFLNFFSRSDRVARSTLACRSLYSSESIGVDKYVETRSKVISQFSNILEKFKSRMNEYSSLESNHLVFTEDLKHMAHLVEPNEHDLDLIERMVVKFCKQNQGVRFGSFIFGPVVMRMYYYLDKPNEALKLFMNPEVGNFFDQLISIQILMDLLYKNQMYTDVLKVFELVKEKQINGSRHPKNAVLLALAACYQMNDEAAFAYSKQLWSELTESGNYPARRAAAFAAALAIKQNNPGIALEILFSMKKQSYVTVRNLKVMALADVNRVDDTFPILRSVLEVDTVQEGNHTFCEEAISRVKKAAEQSNLPDVLNEFTRIEKELRSHGHINDNTLDSYFCAEIKAQTMQQQSQQNFRPGRRINKGFVSRPGLRDML